jgi:hypothetical protein
VKTIVYIPDELKKDVQKKAIDDNTSMSELVASYIRDGLNNIHHIPIKL